MDDRTEGTLSKFVDNAKRQRWPVNMLEGRAAALQKDLDKVKKWADRISTKISARFCTWAGIIPCNGTGCGLTVYEAALQKRIWEP